MNENLKLTARDREVLYDCYSHAVMSFSQVHKRHFRDKSIATVSNRLGQLRRGGYLKRHRVGIALFCGNADEVGIVYQLTRKGHTYLRGAFPNEPIRDEPHRLNPPSLAHDLLLNDTLAALKMRFPDHRLVHGKLFPVPNGSGVRHPDAVILDQFGQPNTAIELELTAKSDTRYRSILVQYMTSAEYKSVLYIVGGSVISDKIKYQITHQKSTPHLRAPSTGKFYFVTLSDLLSDPRQVPISNGSGLLFVF